jgi:hypothetical protein
MKKIWKYMMVALAGLALLACSNKELVPEEEPVEEGYIYNIEIVQTKAVFDENHMAWEGGDVIGWFTDKAGSSEIDMFKDPRRFTVSSTAAMAAGSKVYAYAPYKAGEQSETAAPLSIPTSQSGDDIKDAMPMVALPIELAADMDADTPTSAGQAYFIGLGSVIRYNVYTSDNTYGEEKVESITFTSTSNIAGDFTVDLTGVSEESLPTIDGLDQKSVTSTLPIATTVGNSKPNGIKVYQVIAPGTYSGTIRVFTDQAVYEYSISNKVFTFGKIKPFNVDLASVNATRLSWTEYLLTKSAWRLTGVKKDGESQTTSVGNIVSFKRDGTLVFDCLANDGKSYDHTWTGSLIDIPKYYGWSLDDMRWSINTRDEKRFIDINDGYLLVYVQGDQGKEYGYYEIVEINASSLTVSIKTYGQTYTLYFEAADRSRAYEHSFAIGDFGLTEENIWSDPITDNLSGVSWTLANDQGAYKITTPWEWAGTVIWNGWAWEYEPTVVTLTSSSIGGTITSINLDFTIGANWELTANCTVGGADFGTQNQHFTNTTGDTPKQTATFTGNGNGTIVITVTQPSNTGTPIMLRGINVTYLL